MKLLHCLNSPHIGGIERLVIELAIEQKSQGLDVTVMLDTKKGQYYAYLQEQNIPILDSGIKGGFDFSIYTYKKLLKCFNAYQIIHIHSFSSIRSFAALSSNSKIIYTIHGLSKGVRKDFFFKSFFRESLKSYFFNRADFLIANSGYTLILAKKHYSLKNVKSSVILNGIQLPQNNNKQSEISDVFTIGLVSRFTNRKRIDRLISAFIKFRLMGGIGKLVIVGDGETFTELKEFIHSSDYHEDIDMLGYKSNVEDYYQKFHLCVFPSQNEPFGLVAVEAYLYGKLVLAFEDSGGLKEVVLPIDPESIVANEDALVERLLYWSKNYNLLEENKEKRIAYAENHFSISRMENDYLNIYKTLVSQK